MFHTPSTISTIYQAKYTKKNITSTIYQALYTKHYIPSTIYQVPYIKYHLPSTIYQGLWPMYLVSYTNQYLTDSFLCLFSKSVIFFIQFYDTITFHVLVYLRLQVRTFQ